MAKHANPTVVGGFVVGATVLTIGGILAFGSGNLLAEQDCFIAYFESSVDGLDVGAPIKYRGVQVGTVSKVHAVWDPAKERIQIPVELTFVSGAVEGEDEHLVGLPPDEVMDHLVELGLRATLEQSSFVTGKLFVGLDFTPEVEAVFHGGDAPPFPEIPTTESGFAKLFKSIEDLPIEDLVEGLNSAIAELGVVLADPELKEVIPNLNRLVTDIDTLAVNTETRLAGLSDSADLTLQDVRSLLETAEGEIEPLSQSAQLTMSDARALLNDVDAQVTPLAESFDETLVDIRVVLGRLDEATGGDYSLRLQLRDLLEEAAQAMRDIQALSTYLQQRPEALLTGKK
jgi:paraquat-inducible protein B